MSVSCLVLTCLAEPVASKDPRTTVLRTCFCIFTRFAVYISADWCISAFPGLADWMADRAARRTHSIPALGRKHLRVVFPDFVNYELFRTQSALGKNNRTGAASAKVYRNNTIRGICALLPFRCFAVLRAVAFVFTPPACPVSALEAVIPVIVQCKTVACGIEFPLVENLSQSVAASLAILFAVA